MKSSLRNIKLVFVTDILNMKDKLAERAHAEILSSNEPNTMMMYYE